MADRKYQDGEFEDWIWKILVNKVLVFDTINVTEDERAKEFADRFIELILKPIDDGTIETPDMEYMENIYCKNPYEVVRRVLEDTGIYPEHRTLIGRMLNIVDKEYVDRKDVPEFHPGGLWRGEYSKTWYENFSDDEKDVAIAMGYAEPTDPKPKEQESEQILVKAVCSECGNVREFERTGDDEELDVADAFSNTGDVWECEQCGESNDLGNHSVLSHHSSFTEPVHHEKLEKRFATTNLVEKDFTGQDLSNVDFRKKDCRGAVFIGADLTGADFTGAKLRQADFELANIRKANFANAVLDGAIFMNANVFKTDFSYASLVGADFTWAQMTRLSFEGADLRNATINEAYLADVYFGGANLLNADLFRLDDYYLTDEEFEDFKKRGARI